MLVVPRRTTLVVSGPMYSQRGVLGFVGTSGGEVPSYEHERKGLHIDSPLFFSSYMFDSPCWVCRYKPLRKLGNEDEYEEIGENRIER